MNAVWEGGKSGSHNSLRSCAQGIRPSAQCLIQKLAEASFLDPLIKPGKFAHTNYFTWRFHSRARRCASAICTRVILGAIKSRLFGPLALPTGPAKLYHMYA